MLIERKIGPHSRPGRLAVVDGRSAEAKLMKQIRADLTRHCGGAPSATQRMLIERCATLSLRIHLLDRDIMKAGGMSEKKRAGVFVLDKQPVAAAAPVGPTGRVRPRA